MPADFRPDAQRPNLTPASVSRGKRSATVTWGVPLGGIGTGCIELGNDNRFRNITINNNRDKSTRIPLASRAFLALRTVRLGRVQTRFLQPACDLPFAEAGVIPTFTPVNELTWKALYPCSHYTLNVKDATVEAAWRAMTPFVPHDTHASNIPAMYLNVSLRNPEHTPVKVSFVFNWENLCGCTRRNRPEQRGSFYPVPAGGTPDTNRFVGLRFGKTEGIDHNAEGNYALMAQPQDGQKITVLGWNESDPQELDTFWQQFHYDGSLANQVSRNPAANLAAVCCSRELLPHQECRFLFVLSWYCPKFESDGAEHGNKYAETFPNAVEVGRYALKNAHYCFRAVEKWQSTLLNSSLPRWFSRMLLNSCATFATNTLLTRKGRFAMFETPEDPMTGCLDKRLYSSLATLLLFPELEEAELHALAAAMPKTPPGRCMRYLGRMGMKAPQDGPDEAELADLGPKFVLLACRNFRLSGNRKTAEALFPRLRAAMRHTRTMDKDGHGLPWQSGFSTMYDGWVAEGVNSYTSGLWIAAMRAYAALAELLGHPDEARQYRDLSEDAVKHFESLLWNEERGHYLYCAPGSGERPRPEDWQSGCHTGQLAGEWYAQWMGLGGLFEPGRVRQALVTIQRMNERAYGVVKATMPDGYPCENPPGIPGEPHTEHGWPGIYLAHFACLLLHCGRPDHGLYMIERIFKCVWMRGARAFNHPLSWDCNTNEPRGRAQDRNMSALSVWHAYESLHGVFMDAAAHVLWIRPHLPKGVRFLNVPLFSPTGPSWVRLHEKTGRPHGLEIQLTFHQSVLLNEIVTNPLHASKECHVECATERQRLETSVARVIENAEPQLRIRLVSPAVVHGTLTVILSIERK